MNSEQYRKLKQEVINLRQDFNQAPNAETLEKLNLLENELQRASVEDREDDNIIPKQDWGMDSNIIDSIIPSKGLNK